MADISIGGGQELERHIQDLKRRICLRYQLQKRGVQTRVRREKK